MVCELCYAVYILSTEAFAVMAKKKAEWISLYYRTLSLTSDHFFPVSAWRWTTLTAFARQ